MTDKYIAGHIDRARSELSKAAADMITRSHTGRNCSCLDGSMCAWHAAVYNRLLEVLERLDQARTELIYGPKEEAPLA